VFSQVQFLGTVDILDFWKDGALSRIAVSKLKLLNNSLLLLVTWLDRFIVQLADSVVQAYENKSKQDE
jgi:hypothetical protein